MVMSVEGKRSEGERASAAAMDAGGGAVSGGAGGSVIG